MISSKKFCTGRYFLLLEIQHDSLLTRLVRARQRECLPLVRISEGRGLAVELSLPVFTS